MKLREDDVWIITSPKCGTTWTQETTWHIMNNVQLERTEEPLFTRSPFLDMVTIMGMDLEKAEEMFKKFDDLPSPRTIKTHFPLKLLPPKLLDTCKVIFVNRNVKDACVSLYHHFGLMTDLMGLESEFEDFAKEICPTGLCYNGGGPAYFSMLKCQYDNIDHPNMLILWYENMKQNQRGMVVEIKNHIKYDISEKQIDDLTEFMKFENYQKSSSMNKDTKGTWKKGSQFIRKGIVGDWRNHFGEQSAKDWDAWIIEQFNKTGIEDKEVLDMVKI